MALGTRRTSPLQIYRDIYKLRQEKAKKTGTAELRCRSQKGGEKLARTLISINYNLHKLLKGNRTSRRRRRRSKSNHE